MRLFDAIEKLRVEFYGPWSLVRVIQDKCIKIICSILIKNVRWFTDVMKAEMNTAVERKEQGHFFN